MIIPAIFHGCEQKCLERLEIGALKMDVEHNSITLAIVYESMYKRNPGWPE